MKAYLGTMRLNAARLGNYTPNTFVRVNGTARRGQFDDDTWSVQENVGDQPDTATINLFGFTPTEGMSIDIACGSLSNGVFFSGQIVNIDRTIVRLNEGRPVYRCRAVGWQFLFDRRVVTQKWLSADGKTILSDIITGYTSGFTLHPLTLPLGTLDSFSATDEAPTSVVARLMKRLGGTFVIEADKTVRAWIGMTTPYVDPVTVLNAQGLQGNRLVRDVRYTRDLEKVKTRAIVEGGGSSLAVAAAVGDVRLRVDDLVWYSATGGTVRVDNDLLTYTGTQAGGTGAIVGSGNAPTGTPTPARAYAGAAMTAGAYKYAATYVTAAGETLPGPLINFTAGQTPPATPQAAAQDAGVGGGAMTPGATYKWKLAVLYYSGGEVFGPESVGYVVNANSWKVYIDPALITADPKVNSVNIYRTKANGATFYAETSGSGGWVTVGQVADAALGGAAGASITAFDAAYLSTVPVSASASVTQRKIYRTAVNGSQLKLLTTIANNTATTFYDNVADAALGANAPTSDTSGLTDNRQVPAGSTSLTVSDTTPFDAAGGWVAVGSLPVKYTGISGSDLTGVPASGDGSLSSTVRYGTQVLRYAELTGIPASGAGSIAHTLPQGTDVNIRITRNDTAAQAAVAALEGGDGIHELVVKDNRLNEASCILRGDAELLVAKDVLVQLAAVSSDPNARAGRMFTVNVAEWGINVSLRIQSAEVRHETGYAWPQRRLTTTSQRRSLYDVLRALNDAKG